MGFASDISNQVAQTNDSQGLNPIPGNVVGTMGQPSAYGGGDQAQPFPGNTLGINNPGGTGGGMFGKGSDVGSNINQVIRNVKDSGSYGKGGGSAVPLTELPTPDMSANMIGSMGTPASMMQKDVMPQLPQPGSMMQKDVMPPMVGQNNLPNPPAGTMPPAQVNRATPAQQMKTRPVISQAPQMRQPMRAGGRFRF